MRTKPLLLALLLNALHTVIPCSLDGVQCTIYLKAELDREACLNLYYDECDRTVQDTTGVWYRCKETDLSTNGSSCQQTNQQINTSNGPVHLRDGRLCFTELNATYTGLYCYQRMENSTCMLVQVLKVGRLI